MATYTHITLVKLLVFISYIKRGERATEETEGGEKTKSEETRVQKEDNAVASSLLLLGVLGSLGPLQQQAQG